MLGTISFPIVSIGLAKFLAFRPSAKYSNVTVVVTAGEASAIGIFNSNLTVELNNVTIIITSDNAVIYGIYNGNNTFLKTKNLNIKISQLNPSENYIDKVGIIIDASSTMDLASSTVVLSTLDDGVGIRNSNTTKIKNSLVSAPTAIYNTSGALFLNNSEINGQISGTLKCISSFNSNYDPICQ